MNNNKKALVFIIISTFGFSLMGVLVKQLQGIPIFEKVFFRNLFSFIFVWIILKHKGYKFKSCLGKKENFKFLLLRSLLGFGGIVLNFYAISNLYLADSQILNKTSSFFVTIFAFIFLKESIHKMKWISLSLAIVGALLVIKPEFNLEVMPAIAGLFASILAGGAYTLVRFLGDRENPQIIVFFFSLFCLSVGFPFMAYNFVLPNAYQLLLLIGTGVCALIGQIFLTNAYRFAKASEVSIYTFIGIIFSGIMGYIFWHEIPDFLSIIGGFIIVFSAIINYFFQKRNV